MNRSRPPLPHPARGPQVCPTRAGTVLLGALLLCLTACADTAPSLVLTVQDERGLSPTQLRVTVSVGEASPLEVTRPETAGAPLPPGQTLRVLLPASSVGDVVSLRVEGLRDQQVIALASGTFSVDVAGDQVATVELMPAECLDDGDCGAVACRLAGTCARGVCLRAPEDAGTPCTGRDLCVVNQQCDGTGHCVGGSPRMCPDAQYGDCQVPACDPASGCVLVPAEDGTACDDLNPCTAGDRCSAGSCIAGPFPCNAGEMCCPDGGSSICVPNTGSGGSGVACTAID